MNYKVKPILYFLSLIVIKLTDPKKPKLWNITRFPKLNFLRNKVCDFVKRYSAMKGRFEQIIYSRKVWYLKNKNLENLSIFIFYEFKIDTFPQKIFKTKIEIDKSLGWGHLPSEAKASKPCNVYIFNFKNGSQKTYFSKACEKLFRESDSQSPILVFWYRVTRQR